MINDAKISSGGIGRNVRFAKANPFFATLPPNIQTKEKALIIDFDVDHPQLKKHLKKRIEYYSESGTEIEFVNLNI